MRQGEGQRVTRDLNSNPSQRRHQASSPLAVDTHCHHNHPFVHSPTVPSSEVTLVKAILRGVDAADPKGELELGS